MLLHFFIETTAYLELLEVCDCLEGGGVVGQVCHVWRLPSTPPRVGYVVVLLERPRGQGRHGSKRVIQSPGRSPDHRAIVRFSVGGGSVLYKQGPRNEPFSPYGAVHWDAH